MCENYKNLIDYNKKNVLNLIHNNYIVYKSNRGDNMSKFSYSQVTCPKCNKIQKVKVWDSINVNLDAEQKENIMSGKLFQFICDECRFTTRVEYPCLFIMIWTKNLMIYCIPNFSGDTKILDKMLNKLKS